MTISTQLRHPVRASRRLLNGASLSTFIIAAVSMPQAAIAAPPAPNTLVSVCSGVSLPPSAVTTILSPVLTGIYAPIETNVNGTIGALTNPLLPILGLPAPLNIDVNGLLTTAAEGDDIGLNVLAQDGTLVGPGDTCNATADGFSLDTPAGLAIGGNQITGLGATGQQATAGEINSVALGNRANTDAAAANSIAIGPDAAIGAGGTNSVALGSGANVGVANSVALGAGSVADRGPVAGVSAGEVSIGAPGAERQITNVAAGTAPTDAATVGQVQAVAALVPTNAVSYDDGTHGTVTFTGVGGTTLTNVAAGAVTATSTDAVNGSQLFTLSQQVQNLGASIPTNAVQYDDSTQGAITLGGTGGTTITNVAPGALTATSTDAVNGSQLYATNQQVQTNTTAISNISVQIANLNVASGGAVQYSNAATPNTPNGGIPTNSVTLVGAAAGPVSLHNVAAGTATTDAVNLGQLQSSAANSVTMANAYTDARVSALDFDLRQARRDANAGSAAALAAAGLPQPIDPGKSMIAAGFGTYRGRSAFALGASHVMDNGQSVLKLGLTYDTGDHVGANAGVGFQF